jgi:hypothetical protein
MAEVRKILKASRLTPIERWRKVLETPGLAYMSYEYATEALRKLAPEREREPETAREPGEDREEELIAESDGLLDKP